MPPTLTSCSELNEGRFTPPRPNEYDPPPLPESFTLTPFNVKLSAPQCVLPAICGAELKVARPTPAASTRKLSMSWIGVGSSFSCFVVMGVWIVPFSVLISGASAETCTLSDTEPTLIFMSPRTVSCANTCSPVSVSVLNPCFSALIEYTPGSSSGTI